MLQISRGQVEKKKFPKQQNLSERDRFMMEIVEAKIQQDSQVKVQTKKEIKSEISLSNEERKMVKTVAEWKGISQNQFPMVAEEISESQLVLLPFTRRRNGVQRWEKCEEFLCPVDKSALKIFKERIQVMMDMNVVTDEEGGLFIYDRKMGKWSKCSLITTQAKYARTFPLYFQYLKYMTFLILLWIVIVGLNQLLQTVFGTYCPSQEFPCIFSILNRLDQQFTMFSVKASLQWGWEQSSYFKEDSLKSDGVLMIVFSVCLPVLVRCVVKSFNNSRKYLQQKTCSPSDFSLLIQTKTEISSSKLLKKLKDISGKISMRILTPIWNPKLQKKLKEIYQLQEDEINFSSNNQQKIEHLQEQLIGICEKQKGKCAKSQVFFLTFSEEKDKREICQILKSKTDFKVDGAPNPTDFILKNVKLLGNYQKIKLIMKIIVIGMLLLSGITFSGLKLTEDPIKEYFGIKQMNTIKIILSFFVIIYIQQQVIKWLSSFYNVEITYSKNIECQLKLSSLLRIFGVITAILIGWNLYDTRITIVLTIAIQKTITQPSLFLFIEIILKKIYAKLCCHTSEHGAKQTQAQAENYLLKRMQVFNVKESLVIINEIAWVYFILSGMIPVLALLAPGMLALIGVINKYQLFNFCRRPNIMLSDSLIASQIRNLAVIPLFGTIIGVCLSTILLYLTKHNVNFTPQIILDIIYERDQNLLLFIQYIIPSLLLMAINLILFKLCFSKQIQAVNSKENRRQKNEKERFLTDFEQEIQFSEQVWI